MNKMRTSKSYTVYNYKSPCCDTRMRRTLLLRMARWDLIILASPTPIPAIINWELTINAFMNAHQYIPYVRGLNVNVNGAPFS